MVSVNPALPPIEWRSSAFQEARERLVRGRLGIVLAAGAVTALAAGGAAMMLAERAEVSPGAEGDRAAERARPAAAPAMKFPPVPETVPTAAPVLIRPVTAAAIPAPPPQGATIAPPPRAAASHVTRPAPAPAPAPKPVVEAPVPVAVDTPIGPSFEDSFALVSSASAPPVEVDAVEPAPHPVVLTEAVAKPDAANSVLPGVSQEQLTQQTAALVPPAPPPPDSEPLPPLAEATLAEAPPPPAPPALAVEAALPADDMPEPVAALPPMPPPPPPPPPVPEQTALAAVAQAPTFAGATEAAPIQLSTVASSSVESFPTVVANGHTLGAVTMRDFGSGFATLHLGGLLGLFKLRMPPADYDRLAQAPAAGSFISIDDLRAVGLAVTHDPKSGRLTIGLHPLPPAAPAR